MQRLLSVGIVMAAFWTMFTCEAQCGDIYGELVEVQQKYNDALKTCLDGFEKAENGPGFAGVLNTYVDELEVYLAKSKALSDKEPEIGKIEKMPENIQPIFKEGESMNKKFFDALKKVEKFYDNPQVQAAHRRLVLVYK